MLIKNEYSISTAHRLALYRLTLHFLHSNMASKAFFEFWILLRVKLLVANLVMSHLIGSFPLVINLTRFNTWLWLYRNTIIFFPFSMVSLWTCKPTISFNILMQHTVHEIQIHKILICSWISPWQRHVDAPLVTTRVVFPPQPSELLSSFVKTIPHQTCILHKCQLTSKWWFYLVSWTIHQ